MTTEPAPSSTETETDEGPETGRRPFAAWLQEQRNGALTRELSDALAEVVEAVVEQEKNGKLTLTITVIPAEGGSVFVADQVKAAPPEGEKAKSLFFADGRGNLSRRDPRQAELPLRDASARSKQPRDIGKD